MIKTLMKNIFTPLLTRIQALEYSLGLIADYVVERGTSNGWKYVKWHSGDCVAIKKTTVSSSGSSGIAVATSSELASVFGVDTVDATNTFLDGMNANAISSSVHVESATYNNAGTWYVVLASALSGSMELTLIAHYFA